MRDAQQHTWCSKLSDIGDKHMFKRSGLRRHLGKNKEEPEQVEAEVPSLTSAKELVK